MKTNKEKKYFRDCPQCGEKVGYVSERTCKKAHDNNVVCASCVKKAIWAQENSGLRSEETRKKRNESLRITHNKPDAKIKTEEYRKRASESKKLAHADPNGPYGETYRQNMSKAVIAAYADKSNNMLSNETLLKRAEGCKKAWTPEKRKQHSEATKARWEESGFPWQYVHDKISISKVELSQKSLLNSFGFLHSSERQEKMFGLSTPDYVNETNKLVIEIYGDFWHHNPRHHIFGAVDWVNPFSELSSLEKWELDKKRLEKFESRGYRVLVIWEDELKNEQTVTEKVKLFIEESK